MISMSVTYKPSFRLAPDRFNRSRRAILLRWVDSIDSFNSPALQRIDPEGSDSLGTLPYTARIEKFRIVARE